MNLLLLGINHRTTALDDREALAFGPAETLAMLKSLIARGSVREAALVSTCNRTEFYAVGADCCPERELRDAVARARGRDLMGPDSQRYLHTGHDAVLHLIRVACGLDSMVLGDVQILGQVKDAYVLARDAGSTGPLLDRLFETALHAGKRARSETSVGTGTVSISSAAVALAARTSGLAGRKVLVIGAGETARLAAQHVAQQAPSALAIVNRTPARAVTLAVETGGTGYGLEMLHEQLAEADVVFSATRAPGAIVEAAVLSGIMARRERPIVLFDLALPRDVEPSAASIPGVHLHTLDDVRSVADGHLIERQAQVPDVERIVQSEAERFVAWVRSLGATSTLVALRDHFERIRMEEIDRLLGNATEEERVRADRLTRALVNRLLHVPTLRLKDADPASDDGRQRLWAARDLFALGAQTQDRARRHDA